MIPLCLLFIILFFGEDFTFFNLLLVKLWKKGKVKKEGEKRDFLYTKEIYLSMHHGIRT